MICPNCSTTNLDTASICVNCGRPLSDAASSAPPPTPPPSASSASYTPPPPVGGTSAVMPPPNYLWQSIVVTLCCCLPLGIVAIVFSVQVNSKYAAGDYAGAAEASRNAKMWAWIGFGLGLAAIILWSVFGGLAAVQAWREANIQ